MISEQKQKLQRLFLIISKEFPNAYLVPDIINFPDLNNKITMSDSIKHECGIAMLRLRKPMEYYIEKYGTWNYGLQKMYLMMEKQHNRGQDGAGIAGIKLNVQPGNRYIFRQRSNQANPIKEIFGHIYEDIDAINQDKSGRF